MARYKTDKKFDEIKEILKGTLNPRLIEKQQRTDEQIDKIADHHAHLHQVLAKMEALDPETRDRYELQDYAKLVEEIEFALQDAWGFDKDRNKHSWWYRVPHCACPKMDNEDWYGTECRIYVTDCPVHGEIDDKDK